MEALTRTAIGLRGERLVYQLLAHVYGRKVKRMPYMSPFDLLVDGARVEVKTATLKRQQWLFNLHRHGKLSESTDWYILRLEGVPLSKAAIHLLLRAPAGKTTIAVTLRSLLNGQSAWADDFKRFARGEMENP
jgi:hypothetical protein